MSVLSNVPVGIGESVSLAEAVANYKVVYHKFYEDYLYKYSAMKELYNLRYEGANNGTQFTAAESWTGSGVAHETGEGDDPWAGDIAPGYAKLVTVYQRTYSIALTWFLQYHNKYPDQESKLIRDAAIATAQRLEADMSAPFTYCTSTAYTNIDGRSVDVSSGDSVALASASHTLTNSASLCRNRIANGPQLSEGAVEIGENLGTQGFLDNNGQPLMTTFDLIVTASDKTTYNTALKLVKSKAPVDAPNGNVHAPYFGAKLVRQAFFIDRTFTVGGKAFTFDSTKAKQWMMFDSSNSGLYLFVTQSPTVMPPQTAQLNFNKTWMSSAVYEPCVVDWRCCVISTADGNG